MGNPGSLGNLQNISFDIKIFCTYKEYNPLLRFQKKFNVFNVRRTFSPKSNIFTHFGQGGEENINFYIKPRDLQVFHFLFSWPQYVKKPSYQSFLLPF